MKLGFIGGGNMAEAIIRGAEQQKVLSAKNMYVYDISDKRTAFLQHEIGVNICKHVNEIVKICDITVLAVKPNVIRGVLDIVECENKAFISIAGGVSVDDLREHAPNASRILRVMPNTPLMVGQGATAFVLPTDFLEQELEFATSLFSNLGIVEGVSESAIAQVTAISGCGPAYVYMFIEAMIDAGVKHGLSRELASTLATQTVLGSASMAKLSGKHPAVLKGDVSSPGGITAQATSTLEEKNFRHAIISAVDAAVDKARNM